jgi:hypothetical protein
MFSCEQVRFGQFRGSAADFRPNILLAMKLLGGIIGSVVGVLAAGMLYQPLYHVLWPHATDEREGGAAFFFVFMLGPTALIVGAVAGALLYGKFLTRR